MRTIRRAAEAAEKYLKKQMPDVNETYRLFRYVLRSSGRFYNMVTGEVVELTEKESAKVCNAEFAHEGWMNPLIEKRFLVPTEFNDKDWVDFLRSCYAAFAEEKNRTPHYAITVTTACNAACEYCFQKSLDSITMSKDTADRAADYVIESSKGREASITWYGGEPLLEKETIRRIADRLRSSGVRWSAYLVTNGILFTGQLIEEARDIWNVQKVQITLDGTEKRYNLVKNYCCAGMGESPYQTVMGNMGLLLDYGIEIHVRLNMSVDNYEDITLLIGELQERFGESPNISIHVSIIYDHQNEEELYSDEVLEEMYRRRQMLIDMIKNAGMKSSDAVRPMRMNSCIMDNDNAVLITPDGRQGKCYEFIYMNSHGDKLVTEECDDCVLYPDCFRLTACWKRCREADRRGRIAQMIADVDRIKAE